MSGYIHFSVRRFALSLAAALSLSASAAAQEWPQRPVRITVPALPGSGPDLTIRMLAEPIGKNPGSPLVIINKPGGIGIPAVIELARATPDGNSLLVGNINTNGLGPALHAKKYGFDVKSGIQPVTLLSDGPSTLIASRGTPATFRDAMAAWKASPGKYAYFAAGVGSIGHIWFAKLLEPLGLNLLFVPVKGGSEGLQLLFDGSVHYAYTPLSVFTGQIREGKIRALFVTSQTRVAEFPDLPTLREVGLTDDYAITAWVGLFAPPNLPADLLKRIHATFTAAVNRPEIGERYKNLSMQQKVSTSPADFKKFVDGRIDEYRVVAERARIKVDE
jgi:tripartite-type tricarboxylate transporter receptor subunit TctC